MNDGIVVVDKPAGMTSHDVVNKLRKVFKTKRVGHTGTLDPDATGVLPICIGRATRLAEYLTADDKAYIAEMTFGVETDTQDAAGQPIHTCALPRQNKEQFSAILKEFLGEQTQETPVYSAVKINGTPLYEMARQGIKPENLPIRNIVIRQLDMLSFSPEKASIAVVCSKGTYIRTLCVDIARTMGTCAHVTMLRRTAAGQFTLQDSVALNVLEEADDPTAYLVSMRDAMSQYPQIDLSQDEFKRIKNGNKIEMDCCDAQGHQVVCACFEGIFCAVGVSSNGRFQPRKVFVS